MNVAVFGGSFNPPHIAHVLACALVLSLEEVDRLLLIPTYEHPLGKPLAPYADRVAMCRLAVAAMPAVHVSCVEEDLGGASRTLRTLEHLSQTHSDWRLRLVVGADILAEASRWFGFDAITKLAPLIVLARAGLDRQNVDRQNVDRQNVDRQNVEPYHALPALLPDVSSTRVRSAIEHGDWLEAEKSVPRTVLAYVRRQGLYGAPA